MRNPFRHLRGIVRKAAPATSPVGRLLPSPGDYGAGSSRFLQINWGSRQADFAKEAGAPLENSVVAACVQTITTNWAQAIPRVVKIEADGSETTIEHPLTQLITNPMPGQYDGRTLMEAMLTDWYGQRDSVKRGNAYAYIIANETTGLPLALQFLPSGLVEPRGSAAVMIDRYEYRPDGRLVPVPPARMLHFRNGMDANAPRRGRDPLAACLAEIATDKEGIRWQHSLLKRGGVPAWMLMPKGGNPDDGPVMLDKKEAAQIKEKAMEVFNGEEQGGGMVQLGPMEFVKLGIDPKNMVMRDTVRLAEERICAVIGVPPIVAGLGAGLDKGTYSNYDAALRQTWSDCIIPLQDKLAAEINAKLLPLYGNSENLRFVWDRSHVSVLQSDRVAEGGLAANLYDKGVIDRASAKTRVGEKPDKSDAGVYSGSPLPTTPPPTKALVPFVMPPASGATT